MGSQASSFKEAETAVETPVSEEQIQQIYDQTVIVNDSFWKHVKLLPIYSHGITAWKFCSILHKILWIAPYEFVRKSGGEIQTIQNVGNSWITIHNYGQLNNFFAKYLVNILKLVKDIPYHRNRAELSIDELKKMIESSVIDCGSLLKGILDLLDSNLTLQKEILNWMKNLGLDATSPEGQCRVAPIVLCLVEADQLERLGSQILENFPEGGDQVAKRREQQHESLKACFAGAIKFKFVSDALPESLKKKFMSE